ncbi:hypothetical protein Bca52824_015890 [Brassica carinata]|uniref:GOLD domain-containing protein n=1 Tax=Brassica carinata TaxID=52824 RepID=A0A8X8B615_BRACI|nr:hypothetical protein Bca52824_015890 [Brassica carinata]
MEFDVKSLLDTVNSIHEEMFYLREREEQMQDLNRSTNTKMAWLSLLSLFVCIGVAAMQYVHLKTFSRRRKSSKVFRQSHALSPHKNNLLFFWVLYIRSMSTADMFSCDLELLFYVAVLSFTWRWD